MPRSEPRQQSRLICRVGFAAQLLAVLFVLSAGPAFAAEPELLSEDFGSFAVRPASIGLSGDGTLTLGGHGWQAPDAHVGSPGTSGGPTSFGTINWSRYDDSKAIGSGLAWVNSGIPDDAEGTFHRYPAHIEAGALSGSRYTRLTLRFMVDGVRIRDSYALCEQGGLWVWGGCPGSSSGASIEYCHGPPVFVPGYIVESAVNLSCGAAQGIVHRHRLIPSSALFRHGLHVEHVAGFRCQSFDFHSNANHYLPAFITKGSGYARCTTGKRGFFFSYAE